MSKSKKKTKKKLREKPLSIPLNFKVALAGLLETKPQEKIDDKTEKEPDYFSGSFD